MNVLFKCLFNGSFPYSVYKCELIHTLELQDLVVLGWMDPTTTKLWSSRDGVNSCTMAGPSTQCHIHDVSCGLLTKKMDKWAVDWISVTKFGCTHHLTRRSMHRCRFSCEYHLIPAVTHKIEEMYVFGLFQCIAKWVLINVVGEKLPWVNNTAKKRMFSWKLLKKKNKTVPFVSFKRGIKGCQQWHVRKEIHCSKQSWFWQWSPTV